MYVAKDNCHMFAHSKLWSNVPAGRECNRLEEVYDTHKTTMARPEVCCSRVRNRLDIMCISVEVVTAVVHLVVMLKCSAK